MLCWDIERSRQTLYILPHISHWNEFSVRKDRGPTQLLSPELLYIKHKKASLYEKCTELCIIMRLIPSCCWEDRRRETERKTDRERGRETCPGLISSSTRMGLMASLDERLCKHLLSVHHLPIALQRLIVHSQSHRLLFHWPARNQTQVWNRGNRKIGGTW